MGEHFVFLAAEARQISGTRLLTRPVGLTLHGRDVLVAMDAVDEKHLLVPISHSTVAEDQSSQGVTLGSRTLRVGTVDVAFADLHCRIPSLDLVFERLVDDVVTRLTDGAVDPVSTCRRALDDWRSLLKTAGGGISRENVIGLVGELEVLRHLATHAPTSALDSWRGPSKSVHDFVRVGWELEVKTSTSISGNVITVSNIDQLDPRLVDTLHLLVVHARLDETAPSLDERIDELVAIGVPRGALLAKVDAAGYVYESGIDIDDRYTVRSVRAWLVDDSFPGLRGDEIGEVRLKGVDKIHYELNLDAAPSRLSDTELVSLVAKWTKAET
ncbi:hypothetical protein A5707_16425 [Mycobacterium kyorinense]|uniref:PD-(D/E)XK motif protein n=1 Tax=Mycobacterium kyorinense TaxID=487514 RepID=A0A1A2ZGR6_9MYCO|nr:PD-(D/E)XK motif protein [Mycobacterium kyorinense]OBI49799.1 hypothetical protein A5707_16425 [Mycobacterium kyorinense]